VASIFLVIQSILIAIRVFTTVGTSSSSQRNAPGAIMTASSALTSDSQVEALPYMAAMVSGVVWSLSTAFT